jgi:hypothetical protein
MSFSPKRRRGGKGMSMNILEAYFQQKEEQKRRKKIKIKTCFACIHSSRFDSQGNEVMNKRIFCKAWQGVVYLGSSRRCELFEPYQVQTPLKRRKKRRRW